MVSETIFVHFIVQNFIFSNVRDIIILLQNLINWGVINKKKKKTQTFIFISDWNSLITLFLQKFINFIFSQTYSIFNIFLLFSKSNVCILPYNLLSILKIVYFVHLMIHELYTLKFEKFNECLKSISLRTVLETSYTKKKKATKVFHNLLYF